MARLFRFSIALVTLSRLFSPGTQTDGTNAK
jgi:hypothetical protein